MITKKTKEPFDILIINNTFDQNELSAVWKELDFLKSSNSFLDAEKTSSAIDSEGNLLKQNKAVFLESIYKNKHSSNIIKILGNKLFSDFIYKEMVTINPIYNNYMWINHFNTLVSYYENSDYYKPHSDVAVYSTLTYLYKDPKNFTGGDISFIIENERLDIEIQNNLSIVFPSGYLHEVSPVTILNSGLEDHGRYCISLFAFIT